MMTNSPKTGDQRPQTGDESGGRAVRNLALKWFGASVAWLLVSCLMSQVLGLTRVEAAVSKGRDKQLQLAIANQGGASITSSRFHQQSSIGNVVSTLRITGSRFKILPGFLGASTSTAPTPPKSDLDLLVLYAKTDPFGITIEPQTWQRDNDPIFVWEPPLTGPEVAGYSYALDGTPDDIIDTAETAFNVATAPSGALTDGKHTFSVKAINSAGKAGKPISFELWVDTTPPQIVTYTPAAAMLTKVAPAVSATVSDVGSGVSVSTVSLFINGGAAAIAFNESTGVLTATGGGWKEGANSLELRVADAVGNTQTPLVWSLTLDTKPPTGSVTINAGAAMTTSLYISLGLAASDATSGVVGLLISNDELTGYVEEPYVALREFWKLKPIRGPQQVFVKFVDKAGNVSEPVSDEIDLVLLSPETVITKGPAGFTPEQSVSFAFMCPEKDCVFSFAFDSDAWSGWSPATSATKAGLVFGNHYFRVKAAKDVNGIPDIQPDEEDPSAAERTWIVGVEPSVFTVPKGPHIKMWRLE